MFAGGSPREDTQDLFPAGTDEQEELSENQNVSAFRNTLFSRLQELSVIRQQEELFSEKQDTQNLLQELFQTGHASEQKLLSQDNSKDQDMFPESSAIKSQHENRLSEYHISQQPILSETSDGQQDDESRVFGGGDEQRNAEDIISGTVDNQATFTSGQITQHIGENVCSAGSVDEHCDFFERSATGQDAFSGNLNLGQQVLSASRASLRLNPRVAPRQLHMELDLDYLERRGEHAREPRGPPPETETSPDSMDLVKVILLGAPAVGKTSIIQQFVWNDFSEEYVPTDRKHTYYPSVIINDHLYELKISDIPVIPYFPVNSFYEWTDYRFYGLRSATAYVLVFDLSNTDTFQYIRTLRDQMLESRDMRNVPILVVGNKQDLLMSPGATTGATGGNGAAGGSGTSGTGGTTVASTGSSSGGAKDVEHREKRRDIVNIVKKHWKCTYVECSAKYNWRVVAVFKELMKAVDSLETGQAGKEVCSPMMDNLHDALDRNKCSIL